MNRNQKRRKSLMIGFGMVLENGVLVGGKKKERELIRKRWSMARDVQVKNHNGVILGRGRQGAMTWIGEKRLINLFMTAWDLFPLCMLSVHLLIHDGLGGNFSCMILYLFHLLVFFFPFLGRGNM